MVRHPVFEEDEGFHSRREVVCCEEGEEGAERGEHVVLVLDEEAGVGEEEGEGGEAPGAGDEGGGFEGGEVGGVGKEGEAGVGDEVGVGGMGEEGED